MEGSTPEFVWRAIDIIRRIHPSIEFADEVVKYIKYTFNSNGVWFYPERIGIDNPILKAVKTMAITGPFPLKESYIGIQTMHYLRIQEYLKDNQEGE